MADFYVGQIFEEHYPPEAAYFCDEHNYYLADIPPLKGKKRFQICELPEPTAEEINNLTMTPLDFINVLQEFGLTLADINAYLESNLAVKMQLTYCNNVYCGVAKALMPITYEGVTITAEMVETAFKIKNGVE